MNETMEENNKILWDVLDDECSVREKARARMAFARFRKAAGMAEPVRRSPSPGFGGWVIRIAACMALPLAALSVWLLTQTTAAGSWQETSAQTGQTTEVELADGTHIYLSGGSTVAYPARFRGRTRQVYFNGEGYFEVHADASHPFEVITGDARLRVLGTKFNLKAYSEDPSVSVALDEGHLTFSSTSAGGCGECDMLPGDNLTFSRATGQVRKSVGEGDAGEWRNGMYYYKNETLEAIARSIGRRFGVRVLIENESLIHARYHIALVNGETIDDFVRILSLDSDLNVTRNGNTIIIK